MMLLSFAAHAYETSVSSSGSMAHDSGISSSGGTDYNSGMSNKDKPKGSYGVGSVPPDACAALVNHTPDANVAYQAGVDASGKPVAPADVPGSPQMQIPSKIQFPLTINLAKAANLDTTSYPYNQLGQGTEGVLGTITVEGNQASFNGQPLTDQQQQNLAVLCMKQDNH